MRNCLQIIFNFFSFVSTALPHRQHVNVASLAATELIEFARFKYCKAAIAVAVAPIDMVELYCIVDFGRLLLKALVVVAVAAAACKLLLLMAKSSLSLWHVAVLLSLQPTAMANMALLVAACLTLCCTRHPVRLQLVFHSALQFLCCFIAYEVLLFHFSCCGCCCTMSYNNK